MYKYDAFDQKLVNERVATFRDQTQRFLAGKIEPDAFRALRLRNGLYQQRFAPMLRVSIPYGLLSAKQLHMLAHIARVHDKGYGHFSTRQNIQYNWPKLEEVPDILEKLASVEMHAIQTSGNCIRNITTDHLAGVAKDELVDPRPYCELTRQWASFHPEFNFLPRKFKIAFSATTQERAALLTHDVGVRIVRTIVTELNDPNLPWASWVTRSTPAAASAAHPSSARKSATSCRNWICCLILKRLCACITVSAGATTSTRRASRFWSRNWACRSSPSWSKPSGR